MSKIVDSERTSGTVVANLEGVDKTGKRYRCGMTHHHACECREAHFTELEQENSRLQLTAENLAAFVARAAYADRGGRTERACELVREAAKYVDAKGLLNPLRGELQDSARATIGNHSSDTATGCRR